MYNTILFDIVNVTKIINNKGNNISFEGERIDTVTMNYFKTSKLYENFVNEYRNGIAKVMNYGHDTWFVEMENTCFALCIHGTHNTNTTITFEKDYRD